MVQLPAFDPQGWLLCISFLAGAVQAFAPDRWIPIGVAGWRGRWTRSRLSAVSWLTLLVHVGTGALIYFGFLFAMRAQNRVMISSETLFYGAATLCTLSFVLRAYRYSRMAHKFFGTRVIRYPILKILRVLGPCEALLPILVKAGQLGAGYAAPFLLFLAGTWLSGVWMSILAQEQCDQPLWLPYWLNLASRKRTSLPAFVGMLVAFSAFLVMR